MTFEETTTAHWLYVELRQFVDQLVVCDPYRNKLLSEGAKDDKIDAAKLALLLRSNLLKPVYHSLDHLISLRITISAYNDLIQRGVRLKNQRAALLRAKGKGKTDTFTKGDEAFVITKQQRAIDEYERDREEYEEKFQTYLKSHAMVRNLKTIPGIGLIGAVKLAAIIVSPDRFAHKNQFHAYSGLVRLEKMSGGRSYGSKAPRCNREIKAVFKTAALNATQANNCFTQYYDYMRQDRRLSDDKARHAVARLIATSALAVMRSGKKFNPKQIGALRFLMK
jgi:transposase